MSLLLSDAFIILTPKAFYEYIFIIASTADLIKKISVGFKRESRHFAGPLCYDRETTVTVTHQSGSHIGISRDCYFCIINQTRSTARFAGLTEDQTSRVVSMAALSKVKKDNLMLMQGKRN